MTLIMAKLDPTMHLDATFPVGMRRPPGGTTVIRSVPVLILGLQECLGRCFVSCVIYVNARISAENHTRTDIRSKLHLEAARGSFEFAKVLLWGVKKAIDIEIKKPSLNRGGSSAPLNSHFIPFQETRELFT